MLINAQPVRLLIGDQPEAGQRDFAHARDHGRGRLRRGSAPRYYRERGMHEASVLFSEPGLAIPRPEEDVRRRAETARAPGTSLRWS